MLFLGDSAEVAEEFVGQDNEDCCDWRQLQSPRLRSAGGIHLRFGELTSFG